MKILMVTPYLPFPPASGGQIRTFNLLRYLSQNNEITLVSLYKHKDEKKYVSHLEPYCKSIYLCKRPEKPWQPKNILKAIFSLHPFLVVRNFSSEAETVLRTLIKKESFDVIHAETFYIMPHIPHTKVPVFLVEQTIEFKVYQHFVNSLPFFLRPFFYLDILKLKYWERYYWKKALLVGTVSESDRQSIKQLEPYINPVVIPNGAGEEMIVESLKEKSLANPTILFQGNFYWLQNTEAAEFLTRTVFPFLQKTVAKFTILIAGQNANNKIKLHDKQNAEQSFSIVDIAPDDSAMVRKIYHESTIFVAPIFGPGGTRLKILAAMASGLPVIATKTGLEGLAVVDNEHVLIANTPEEFALKIQLLLSNKTLYERIRANAYHLVQEKYNWEKIAQSLEVAYKRIKTNDNRN